MIILGFAAVAAASWGAAPIVSMARKGTIDQQTVAAWKAEGEAAQVHRAERRAALVRASEISIPEPRRAPDDLPQRSELIA